MKNIKARSVKNPNKINSIQKKTKSIPMQMVIKLLKTTNKKKILKAVRKKNHITFQGPNKDKIRLSAIFSKKKKTTVEARK